RPVWATFADELMRQNVPQTEEMIPEAVKTNIIQQEWKTSKNADVPQDIREMLKVIRRNEVRLEGIAIERDLLLEMPIWLHKKADKRTRRLMNSAASRCLRERHGVRTVADAVSAETILGSHDHRQSNRCSCKDCEWTWNEYNCPMPHACAKRAKNLLDLLPPKWDPRCSQPFDKTSPTPENPNREAGTPISKEFRIKDSLANTIRIFGNTQPNRRSPP
ncbi:hypothetical protein DL96DRAFT_1417281, partial [Flagelloscypha sp. PMI_526]